ncbi:hypothetical protein [Acinetobacter guillouiae]|uniref:hypothetical protein n=1 Tax=Acinetobacter guillouiae TaxID=106649 RepID=UPI003AF49A69
MDKLIIEFNKKFDKQKQELIDGFKALGEEKRLPKALATIEGEQPTYKDYFKAGWQSRQAEVDEYKMVSESIEDLYLLEHKKIKAVEQVLSDLKESMTDFKEMDLYDKGVRVVTDYIIRDLEKALRGEHE